MLDSLFQFIAQSPAWLVFLTVFAASYIENIFPPIPGDTILVFGAYMVGRGDLSFPMAMVTTLLGSVLGFMTLYVVGLKYGRGFMYSANQSWFSPQNLERVEQLFNRWGYGVVLINRFMAGMRSMVGLFSGIGRLSVWKVIVLATVSSLLWNGTLLWLGASIGENWEQIVVYLKRYNSVVTVLIVLVISAFIIHRYVVVRRNISKKQPQ